MSKEIIGYFENLVEIDFGKLEKTFSDKDGLKEFLGAAEIKVNEAVKNIPADMSVAKNRVALRSVGARIKGGRGGSLRAGIDKVASALMAVIKKEIKDKIDRIALISTSKNEGIKYCDELHAKIIAPAVNWENAEKERKEELQAKLAEITVLRQIGADQPSSVYREGLTKLQKIVVDESFHELEEKAKAEFDSSDKFLNMGLELAKSKEAEAARIAKEKKEADARAAKEKKEADARAAKEREDILKREAAEKARIESEKKAQEAAEEVRRKIQEETDRLHSEKIVAELRAEQAIKRQKEAEDRAKERELRAEQEREEASKKAEQEKEEAATFERRRIEAEREAEAEARRKREADKEHKKKIEEEIIDDMLLSGFDKLVAANLIFQISVGKIRHVHIEY